MCNATPVTSSERSQTPCSPSSRDKMFTNSRTIKQSRSNEDLMALKQEVEMEMNLLERNDSATYSMWNKLNSSQQFMILTFTMFLFFGMHNILQEAMMKVEGFHGVMLAYMEVLG